MLGLLTGCWTPAGCLSLFLGAKPSASWLVHIDVAVIEAARKMIDALALTVQIFFDCTVRRWRSDSTRRPAQLRLSCDRDRSRFKDHSLAVTMAPVPGRDKGATPQAEFRAPGLLLLGDVRS